MFYGVLFGQAHFRKPDKIHCFTVPDVCIDFHDISMMYAGVTKVSCFMA